MTKTEWIRQKLIENELVVKNVAELYETFLYETGSEAAYASYYNGVCNVKSQILQEGVYEIPEEDDDKEDYIGEFPEFTTQRLKEILENNICELKHTLSNHDLEEIAENNNIPSKLFHIRIPDLKDFLSTVYSLNLFHIEAEKSEDKLKSQIKILKRELNHYKSINTGVEVVVDSLGEALKEYEPLHFKYEEESHKDKIERHSVLLLSDAHFDEIVDKDEVHGLNEYSPEIARKRLDKLFNQVVRNAVLFDTDILHIKFLGDMVSGIIHQELLMGSDLGITNSVIELADYIAQWIQKLSHYFQIITCIGIVGNHGRFFSKPYFKKKAELNFDYILYEFIRRETKQIVKEFTIPKSAFLVSEILGYGFLDIHGDQFLGGNGMSPVSGAVNRDIAKMAGVLRERGQHFNYVNMGHFHTDTETKSFDGIPVILNGSIIGTNEYSLNKIKRGEKASQTFYIVEKGSGVRFIDRIKLN